jgi:2-phospho-L-lactate/phosphoenolpyruvate guanylyltransferase
MSPLHGVSLVIPVKSLSEAKSRLNLPAAERRMLALAMLAATVTAAASSRHVGLVLVVTPDPLVALTARRAGARTMGEPQPRGLNAALHGGRLQAVALCPRSAIGFLMADLPSLDPADLDDAIEQFQDDGSRMIVVDHTGSGTTLGIHGPRELPSTHFGPGSALAHQRAGFKSAQGALTSLRRDIDTPGDLRNTPQSPIFRRCLLGVGLQAASLQLSATVPDRSADDDPEAGV